mmetsp:Transcript_12306/g.38441  ORF Transcript_12306/g.38441 Transcript_12306/m.38441 type:complete len:443 (+) Transcript_12306:177-1505(+)
MLPGRARKVRWTPTSEQVAAHWPPASIVAEPPEVLPVRRPHLWLAEQETVGVSDVGRFVKIPRDDLIELLPEGACGQFARDLTLIPSHTRPVGLMLRKLTVELIAQLSLLRDARDARGERRIRKSGFLVDGRPGTGKSQVLNLLAMWARRNGWLVVLEPTPSRYRYQIADIKRSNNGVYIQNEFAQQFLEATSIANRQKLEEIPVDRAAYGSRAIDGEPVSVTKRLYEHLIDKTVEREAEDQDLSREAQLERVAEYRAKIRLPSMAQQLPDPVNVWEIVDFGLQNESYATQAVAEMFLQLQRQTTHPVLVIVDEWNECFPVSHYVSVRYDNTRFHGYIPGYHLTMPRALHEWDGRKYRRGLKICATSWTRYRRRDYDPSLLGVKEEEIRTVRNFSQHEFANYVTYLRLMNVLHNFPREDLGYYYMMTQGNGWEARKMLATLY